MSKVELKLKCQHCGWEWNYKGTKKHLATCPDCHYKVKIPQKT